MPDAAGPRAPKRLLAGCRISGTFGELIANGVAFASGFLGMFRLLSVMANTAFNLMMGPCWSAFLIASAWSVPLPLFLLILSQDRQTLLMPMPHLAPKKILMLSKNRSLKPSKILMRKKSKLCLQSMMMMNPTQKSLLAWRVKVKKHSLKPHSLQLK